MGRITERHTLRGAAMYKALFVVLVFLAHVTEAQRRARMTAKLDMIQELVYENLV